MYYKVFLLLYHIMKYFSMYSTPMIYIYLRTLNKFEMNYYGNMLIVDKKMLSCVVFFTKRVTLLCLSSANNQHLHPVSLSLSLSLSLSNLC